MSYCHKMYFSQNLRKKQLNLWLGLILVAALSFLSAQLASLPTINALGLSSLTIAMLLGFFVGNSFFRKIAPHTDQGVDYAKNKLLRLGIIFYGFHITFQQLSAIGWSGLLIALSMVCCTFLLALLIGTKLLKLDTQTVMLIGAGSSICGAAAVMATEPVVKGQASKVSVAVATVVVFGTISMFLYPILYPYLQLSPENYGVFAGSTIHEVAQVVVAGKNISEIAASSAVIEKMLRVMLLAPFLMVLSIILSRKTNHAANTPITIPWFAVLFIMVALFNSVVSLPSYLYGIIHYLDTFLLTMAMAALGIRTNISAIKQAGVKPLILGSCLFIFLLVGGYFINIGITQLIA